MLTVVTWLWGDKFNADDVHKLASGVSRNLEEPHRFICVADDTRGLKVECATIRDTDLLKVKGCFARLRLFDPDAQRASGIVQGERIVGIDLDTIITGPLDPLFDRPESFVIMQGGNAVNPCPYNGALMMLRAGVHPEVWSDFSLEAVSKVPFHSFPDDQGWIAAKVPNAAGWKVGPETGVYVYQKPGWPGGKTETKLPDGARLVTFINRTPKDIAHLDWVQENWR